MTQSAGHLPDNWVVLLPLHDLHRLMLPESAGGSSALSSVLKSMQGSLYTCYVGEYSGDVYHEPLALRGSRWMQCMGFDGHCEGDEEGP